MGQIASIGSNGSQEAGFPGQGCARLLYSGVPVCLGTACLRRPGDDPSVISGITWCTILLCGGNIFHIHGDKERGLLGHAVSGMLVTCGMFLVAEFLALPNGSWPWTVI